MQEILPSGSFNVCLNSDSYVLSSGCQHAKQSGVGNEKYTWVIFFLSTWYIYTCLHRLKSQPELKTVSESMMQN